MNSELKIKQLEKKLEGALAELEDYKNAVDMLIGLLEE